jgi:AcrR family transcriptional regulator
MSRAASARGRLTRERILRAALEFADANGIDALTMRELGRSLGFEAMALYRHVAGKDEILDGILDLVLEEVEPPPPSPDWAAAIRSGALSLHAALERHPWATRLMTSANGLRPVRLAFAEAVLARLEDAGFSEADCFHAYHVVDAYILGFSHWQAAHTFSETEQAAIAKRLANDVSFDDYPLMQKHREQHRTPGPHRDVSAFEVGLELMLEGLQELRVSRGSAAPARTRRR